MQTGIKMKFWDSINPAAMLGSMGIGTRTETGTEAIEATEKDRLGNCMRLDEMAIQEKMSEIGRLFYEKNKECTNLSEEYLELFDSVKKLENSRMEYYQQILCMEGNMLCLNCQAVIPLGSAFCNHCGKKIVVVEREVCTDDLAADKNETVQMKKRYCANCNTELGHGEIFCMKCGAKIDV